LDELARLVEAGETREVVGRVNAAIASPRRVSAVAPAIEKAPTAG
jgi:hypothetical protein